MNTYYLQYSAEQGRLIIDDKQDSKLEQRDMVEANSWIEAKYNLGYPLTSRQERMLK